MSIDSIAQAIDFETGTKAGVIYVNNLKPGDKFLPAGAAAEMAGYKPGTPGYDFFVYGVIRALDGLTIMSQDGVITQVGLSNGANRAYTAASNYFASLAVGGRFDLGLAFKASGITDPTETAWFFGYCSQIMRSLHISCQYCTDGLGNIILELREKTPEEKIEAEERAKAWLR